MRLFYSRQRHNTSEHSDLLLPYPAPRLRAHVVCASSVHVIVIRADYRGSTLAAPGFHEKGMSMTTTAQRYAISRWPDTDELIAKGHRLVSATAARIRGCERTPLWKGSVAGAPACVPPASVPAIAECRHNRRAPPCGPAAPSGGGPAAPRGGGPAGEAKCDGNGNGPWKLVVNR